MIPQTERTPWHIARRRAASAAIDAVRPVVRFALRHWIRHEELIRVRQQIRYLAYAELLRRAGPAEKDLTLCELSVFSQNGEDGVIQEILKRLGEGSRFFVEIGASPNESNCMFLADALGWGGVFVDASDDEYEALSRKYSASTRVKVRRDFVTGEHIDRVLERAGVPDDVDVLSIDVDGNDYWLWEGLRRFRPRVVVVEINADIPPGLQLVQRNDPERAWDGTRHYGASLGALCRLAVGKGYRLVHVDTTGTNAFFVDGRVVGAADLPDEDDVVARVPNHFLYGLRYERDGDADLYLDLGSETRQDLAPSNRGTAGRLSPES